MRERILGAAATDEPPKTVVMVPLSDLIDLARLGAAMRKAQQAYFDARRRMPHVQPRIEYNAAREAERRFDGAVRDALNRERISLPGCD